MRSFPFLVFCFSIATTSACNSDVYKAYKNEVFDSTVFKDFKVYDDIKNILVLNIDTIFSLRNTKRQIQGSKKVYLFEKNSSPDSISLQDMPPFIYLKVDRLLKGTQSDSIVHFSINRKNNIIIIIDLRENYDKETDVEIQHTLVWNWYHLKFPFKFQKDTVLPGDWKYYILCFYKHQSNLK